MKSQPAKRAQQDKKPSKKASGKPTLVKWDEMNRKQRREMMRKMQSEDLNLEVVHPHAAGLDIGNASHYVAVPPTRDPQPVRCFGCTTAELKKMAELADTMQDSHGRAAIYGSVLDCGLRHFGRGGSGSVSGECA